MARDLEAAQAKLAQEAKLAAEAKAAIEARLAAEAKAAELARAQAIKPLTPAEAKQAYADGRLAYRNGDWVTARKLFEQAKAANYKPDLFEDSPELLLSRMDRMESGEKPRSTTQASTTVPATTQAIVTPPATRNSTPVDPIRPRRAPTTRPVVVISLPSSAMRFNYIAPGKFTMGSPPDVRNRGADEHQHPVTLTRGFYLLDAEITRGQFRAVMGDDAVPPSATLTDDHPVANITWEQAVEFCKRLTDAQARAQDEGGAEERRTFRLPTEAEWEYACRGGSKTLFAFGDMPVASAGNFPVGETRWDSPRLPRKYPRNGFNLYDMHGNVAEWCADRYGEYPAEAATDPTGPEDGATRVVRGGSFDLRPELCRSSSRGQMPPDKKSDRVGFRVALTID